MNHNTFRESLHTDIDNVQIHCKHASRINFLKSSSEQNLAPATILHRKTFKVTYVLLFAMMATIPFLLFGCRGTTQKEGTHTLVIQKSEPVEEQKDGGNALEYPDDEIESYKDSNEKYGYKLKTTGEILIPAKYDYAWPFREGLAHVRSNGKFGFVDKLGKEVIPLKYDLADFFREGLTIVELDAKYGFIDKSGNVVIPFKYDGGFTFQNDLAVVQLDGKYGYIDKMGNEVIPFKYDWAWSFSGGKAKVKLNGEEFYIDKNGNRIEE